MTSNAFDTLESVLEVALGLDTADLAFRTGILSGPETGGVLRGQTSRFQIVGNSCDKLIVVSQLLIETRIP